MDEISVKGEKYIKAGLIASKFGYTQDYVGQLCRGKQVKATLVGRSWYVNEDSLKEHKKGRYRSSLVKSVESLRELSKDTASRSTSGFLSKLAKYELDEKDLIPSVKNKKVIDDADISSKKTSLDLNVDKDLAENTYFEPKNKQFSGSSEKVNVTRVLVNKPPVRVIYTSKPKPSSASSNDLVFAQNKQIPRHESSSKRKTGKLPALLLASVLLLVVVSASVSFFGLEKRIVTIADNTNVVVYDFNFTPAKNFFDSHHFNF